MSTKESRIGANYGICPEPEAEMSRYLDEIIAQAPPVSAETRERLTAVLRGQRPLGRAA